MMFSLDYDETFSADPDFWRKFIELARSNNHQVIMITRRFNHGDHGPITDDVLGVEIVYTANTAKRDFCRANGIPMPDVWIDDGPEGIIQ